MKGLQWVGRVDPRLPLETLEVEVEEGVVSRSHGGSEVEDVFRVFDEVVVETEKYGFVAAQIVSITEEVVVRWFCMVSEVPKARRGSLVLDENRDLFETDDCDAIPATSLVTKIKIGDDYLCRFVWKADTGNIMPLGEEETSLAKKRRNRRGEEAFKKFEILVSETEKRYDDSSDDEDEEEPHRKKKKTEAELLLQKAVKALQLRSAPKSLPRRENERKEIETFVREALRSTSGRSLYVSGMPGTGKTATVQEVVRRCREDKTLDSFDFVEINAMRLPRPAQAYSLLHKAIFGGAVVAGENAARRLDAFFSSDDFDFDGKKKRIVCLVDELDFLNTKNETVLYNFFEWPTKHVKSCSLCVIGIANTMDLPEKLEPKVRSRLGCRRLVFQPYSLQDLQAILRDRLRTANAEAAFADSAVVMAARKVSAYSGDVRRALQICARAAETCATTHKSQVQIQDINEAFKSLTNSSCLLAVKEASPFQRIVLVALCLEFASASSETLSIHHIFARLQRFTILHSDAMVQEQRDLGIRQAILSGLSFSDTLQILYSLHDANILSLEPNPYDSRTPNVRFNIDDHDIRDTLITMQDPLALKLLKKV